MKRKKGFFIMLLSAVLTFGALAATVGRHHFQHHSGWQHCHAQHESKP